MLSNRTTTTNNNWDLMKTQLIRIAVVIGALILCIVAIVIIWATTGRHYSQLIAFAATLGLTALGGMLYQLTISRQRPQGQIGIMLVLLMALVIIIPLIDASLLPIAVALAFALALVSRAHLGPRWGLGVAIASTLILIFENAFARSFSNRVFGSELGQEFAQSGIPFVLIIPIVFGLILIGLKVLGLYEAALANEKSIARMLIDNLPDHIYVKDAESRIIINNKLHALLLGNSTPDQVVGKSDFDFFPKELAQQYYESEQNLMHSGEQRFTIEEPTIDPSGKHHWFLTTKVIVRDANQNPKALVGVSRDVTDLKQAEQERDNLLHSEREQKNNLEVLIKHISEVVRQMNNVVNTILNTSQEQSASMVEQESSVAETMATVEQLRATVKNTADAAKGVAVAADNSIAVSRSGEESVTDAIQGMSSMKQRVENIAENILTLSERTQQIDEIIGTVNALAEQSKLLALNASIEAARAGNEGRGFAVVAMEVRQLAEQSREATARIRAILTEIQQATNTAVMVTEEGSKQAERGMVIVEVAGKAIRNLESIIGESAQTAQQIAGSTHQQMIGMEQLSIAMSNIRVATSQTVTNTRQMENSVQELIAMSQRLEQAADQYRA